MSAPLTTVLRPARALGIWSAVAIVMGNMIGSGVFLLPASLAAYRGLSLVGWLLSAAGAMMLALVFSRLSRQMPAAGGLYAYTRAAFGPAVGFLVGWGYWLSSVATLGALAVAFVGYLDPFIPALVRLPTSAAVLAVAAIWLLVGVNAVGVRSAARMQIATLFLKLLPLLVVGIGGLLAFQPEAVAWPPPGPVPVAGQIVATMTLTLWAFLGLECATIPADSVRDPETTIPRATIAGTLAAAVIYIVATVGVMSLVPAERLANSTAPFADGAEVLFGAWGARFVALGAAISCFGALNGWVLVCGHLPRAAAADNLFPRLFGRVSSRGTPVRAMAVSGLLASALVGMNYSRGLVELFTFIILLSTLSTLVPYAFCALAVWLMPNQPRLSIGASIIGVLAFTYAIFAMYGAGQETVFYGFLLLMSGLPVYVWLAKNRDTTT